MATYRPGTVVRYRSERENRWCREGLAIANDDGRLVDQADDHAAEVAADLALDRCER